MMPDIDHVRNADATWLGFIEHLRTHPVMDAPLLKQIATDGGKLTAETARRIAIEYQVARNFPSAVADRYELVAEAVNETAASWPDDMESRIESCLELVDRIQNRVGTKRKTVSAATKFLWFVRPVHWLPYDRHAANGLVGLAPAVHRMRRYFEQLARSDFPTVADGMSGLLEADGFDGLSGERLVDKALMIRGLRKNDAPLLEAMVRDNFVFLSEMPAEKRKRVMSAATRLTETFPDTGVPREARNPRKRKLVA